ncbi:MAG: hypothetical protein EOP00_29850 [Pedobacter sp.]|nr:MAG: hypothetical protein EOP00_29850 [Pedobacter sp.]
MKRILIGIFLISCFKLSFSQKANKITVLNFSGVIANYPVEMRLEFSERNDSIQGAYYYKRSGFDKKIYLQGTIVNGYVTLTENAYNQNKKKFEDTGYFNLSYQNGSLSGSWQKTPDATKEKILFTILVRREDLSALNLSEYQFIFTRKPYNYKYTEDYTKTYHQLLSLDIKKNNVTKWLLKGFNEESLMTDNDIILEDINFDGLVDIKIPINFPGRTKSDFGFLYFIYNRSSNNFIQNQQLNDLEFVESNTAKKEILKYDADGNGNEGTKFYKWQNRKLYLVREERVYENDVYTHYTEYGFLNGKNVVTKTYKKK